MPDTSKLEQILERTNRLLALQLIKGLPLREAVVELDYAGFQGKEIARIVQKTPNHVAVILYESRKKRPKEENDGPSVKRVDGGDPTSDTATPEDTVQKTL